MEEGRLGFHVRTDLPFDAAEAAAREALKAEGFGVLTEIDVQATLAEKIGVEMERYKILDACNPRSRTRRCRCGLASGCRCRAAL